MEKKLEFYWIQLEKIILEVLPSHIEDLHVISQSTEVFLQENEGVLWVSIPFIHSIGLIDSFSIQER
jgi:hypothetical protein